PRPLIGAVLTHPAHERVRRATEREQEEHPATLVRATVAVLVLPLAQPLLEEVEYPMMLGPGLLHLIAQELVLEPEVFRLLARAVEALLEHPILHAVSGG